MDGGRWKNAEELVSTSGNGQKIIRCESPSFTTEMRLGETRIRENLAFVPMEVPITGEDPRKITFGLVREGGNWKLLSVGLMMLDVPAMAKQWAQADLDASEDAAIADLHSVALALDTYRRAYGKLPDTLSVLGPAPPNGISPETASLLDADLAAGNKDGYTIRYRIIPAAGSLPEEGANKAETFSLASSPNEYGKAGRRSFFLDSSGILRGADKQVGHGDNHRSANRALLTSSLLHHRRDIFFLPADPARGHNRGTLPITAPE